VGWQKGLYGVTGEFKDLGIHQVLYEMLILRLLDGFIGRMWCKGVTLKSCSTPGMSSRINADLIVSGLVSRLIFVQFALLVFRTEKSNLSLSFFRRSSGNPALRADRARECGG
jgi:hypothetical protein